MKSPSPPKIANKFLEWYCKSDMLEDLQGSLHEYYHERVQSGQKIKAKWMFLLDVFMHFRPHTVKFKTQNSKLMLATHFKVSLRNIRIHRLSTLLNTIGLGTGIACFILVFLWARMELSYDSFHTKSDRIYRISNTFKSESETFSQAPSGPALGAQLDELFSEVEEATRFSITSERLRIENQYFFESELALVDPNFLRMFDFSFTAGDRKSALDDPQSIVLTEAMASKYFADRNPIGESIYFDEYEMKVTGIISNPPDNSQMNFSALIPIQILRQLWDFEQMDDQWGGGYFHTYLQLTAGSNPEEVEKDITAFIGEKLTSWAEHGMYYEYFLQPLESIHLHSSLRYDHPNMDIGIVNIFIVTAIIILLLACINYINLATANAINRSKEVGIRKIIGAAKQQLVIQYLVESLIIVLVAMSLAFLLVWIILPSFLEITGYSSFELFTTENIVLLVGLVIALSVLAGLLPSFLISKVSAIKVIKGNLKSGSQYNLMRKGLVIVQFTATVVLLISILVMNDQMSFIRDRDLGMETDGIVRINFRGYSEVRDNASVLKDQLLQLPEVRSVSFLRNSYPVFGLSNSGVDVETGDGTVVRSSIYTLRVDEDFAKTFNMELVSGRFFSRDFPADSSNAVVVNEACINNFGWKNATDAIGKEFGTEPNVRKVIGVVKNFNFERLHKQVEPVRILPVRQSRYSSLVMDAQLNDVQKLYASLEAIWEKLAPTVPLDVAFMNDDLKRQYQVEYKFLSVFSTLTLVSIVIGCLGLFGLATATTNRRLREVGIRKVLGASIYEILTLINKDFVLLILISALLASPIAYFLMTEWLDYYTYNVGFNILFILFASIGALLLTILTVSLKTFRTAQANPAEVLKEE